MIPYDRFWHLIDLLKFFVNGSRFLQIVISDFFLCGAKVGVKRLEIADFNAAQANHGGI